MNNSAEHKFFAQGRPATRMVLALSALILILSCPIKRYFQIGAPAQMGTHTVVKQKQEREASARVDASCSSVRENEVVRIPDFSAQQQLHHDFVAEHHSSGFGISYYLSRSKNRTARSENTSSFLPLFLQHRSLLI